MSESSPRARPGSPERRRAQPDSPGRRCAQPDAAGRRCARSCLWLVLAVYTATFTGLPDNPDGEVAFQTTRALATAGTLAIGGTPEAETIVAHARAAPPGGATVRAGVDGRWYAWFGVGHALAAVPLYWCGAALAASALAELERDHFARGHWGLERSEYAAHVAVGWRNPLCGALTASLVVLVALRLGARRRDAWIAGAGYALATFAWPQARSSLSDVQGALLLFLAFHWILALRDVVGRERAAPWLAAGAGAALGAAVLTRVSLAGAALVLACAAVVVIVRARSRGASGAGRRGTLALLALPIAAAAAIFAWTNWTRFGDPLDSGYGVAVRARDLAGVPEWRALAGLVVSPGRGLAWFAPAILLAPLGLARAWRSGERFVPIVVFAVALAVLAPPAQLALWHGAWTWGPRYLLPLVPFAWIGVALALALAPARDGEARSTVRARGGRLRTATLALLALGFVVQLPGVLVDTMTYHDLAVRAAPLRWPALAGSHADQEAERFERLQWELGFAPPLAHARILAHRLGNRRDGRSESFPVREIFGVDADAELRPSFAGLEGFRHLAWIDLRERLGRSLVLPGAVVALLVALAAIEAWRAARASGARSAAPEPQAIAPPGRKEGG